MISLNQKLGVAIAAFGLMGPALAATTVYVPVGSTNEVLVIDTDSDRVGGSIGDVTSVHGLTGSATKWS